MSFSFYTFLSINSTQKVIDWQFIVPWGSREQEVCANSRESSIVPTTVLQLSPHMNFFPVLNTQQTPLMDELELCFISLLDVNLLQL